MSFEYPQHMFWLRNKKNKFQLHTLIFGPVYHSKQSKNCFFSFKKASYCKANGNYIVGFMLEKYVGESFQDYSQIQDFEADFPQKASYKY